MPKTIVIILLFFASAYSQLRLPNSLNRSFNRSNTKWRCENGFRISYRKLCDGHMDCFDGSDETFKSCRHFFCKPNQFRCAYGGCIDANYECNGLIECHDNSDEETPNCPEFVRKILKSGSCGSGYFQCHSGECIHEDEVCDGRANCVDSSDETEEECSSHYCHELNFQCKYGACILEVDKCNGIKDCVDGSDERDDICLINSLFSRNSFPSEYDNSTNVFDGVVMNIERASIISDNDRQISNENNEISNVNDLSPLLNFFESQLKILKCLYCTNEEDYKANDCGNETNSNIQFQPSFSKASEETRLPSLVENCTFPNVPDTKYQDDLGNEIKSTFVTNGDHVNVICLGRAKIIGSETNRSECINGSFTPNLVTCQNQCSRLQLNTLSFEATCHNPNGETIPCTPLLPPKTVALLSCKVGYKKPERVVRDAITCLEDGNWDYRDFKCEQVCGVISDGSPNVVGGYTTNITQVPWHAAIYVNQGENKLQICGGSIINPTAIVTAAHCFWDPRRQELAVASQYVVVVGKSLRDFFAEEPSSQVIEIKKIDVAAQYTDSHGLYVADIAVLVLKKPIIFNSHISPICMDSTFNDVDIQPGVYGRVAGWGLTTTGGHPSPVLKVIDLPVIDFQTCRRESPPGFREILTTDKYCAGFLSGESVCVGDSGGGMVIKRNFSDSSYAYFLNGVVSIGPHKDGSCDNNKYSAFTNVYENLRLLIKYILNS